MHCCRTAETDIIQLPFLLRNRHVMNKFIYLDNAATTRVRPEVADSMRPFLENMFANPAGVYTFAGKTNVTIEEEREKIARFIGAKAKEIYFTGGGSESDNWALKGIASANKEKGRHIITSKIEHPAILRTCEFLEKKGFEITYIDVDDKGFVDLKMLEKSIRADTILISIMLANNEIGTIEPVRKIAEIAKEHGVLFHTDAVQAYGHVDINVKEMGIDLMSVSGHKINGPKGIGFLYIRSGVRIENLIHGGSQERGMRAGTVNVAGIVGMGTATELAEASLKKRFEYETQLRDYMIDRVEREITGVRLNGDRKNRLSNNINFSFENANGEMILIMLDQMGICASAGSACSAGSVDPSHVLLAIGLPEKFVRNSLRITISYDTTKDDIDYTVDSLKQIVERLRKKI